jgi:hypothetical protein
VLIDEALHKWLQRQDCRHVAYDVGEQGGYDGQNIGIVEVEGLHGTHNLRREQNFLRCSDDDE